MNESIDPSEWLHKSVEKIYPELMRQLGAVAHNGRIVCSSRFTFDDLYRYPENHPILNASHLSAAEFITTLRGVAFEKSSHTRLREMIVDLTHGKAVNLNGYCPMTLYCWIMKELSPLESSMVERICWKEMRSNDIGWIIQCSETIRKSFEKLGLAIENSLDRMKKQQENEHMKRGQMSPKIIEPA